ncbi:hypothetical protein PSN45_003560 [Yamadazyma tenuis]|uniref:Mitochondrial thiamine pyrophosphate carrier 1 n=1 Tax=Candida tenuis (strain ATCC 10573 / BCRC 21748 / CBS 615 / JCM 9827 / NBRC 10315 / NRRL Y-1498 / VKM Y-70) TaxID=590646 RepID=G3AXP2_CANTC|nr:uncharacterized protein CANTEDRAFT_101483 [Yamadazyma tenuis ATCC 10573]EGV65663.1 hypothetical protein CANTEDRAFT_101483 [Yamadazyma tenuis ATCC 10573]WEJ96026.1 hypothetical protein PSN45_003560 [Yamadazyma tenuis]
MQNNISTLRGSSLDSLDSVTMTPSSGEDLSTSKNNQAVTVSTAGVRALIYQLQALYMRTPVKLFRPSRFDYLAHIRTLAHVNEGINLKPWRFTTHSSLALLVKAVNKQGWRLIPEQVLPPLLANSATGLILYGTYLSSLDHFDGGKSSRSTSSWGPLQYSPIDTWRAGFVAGIAQSLAAAPVDAIYARSSTADIINGKHSNLWVYGLNKLKEIGLVGVFAGYGFSLIKESFGFAFYFCTFEVVKNQCYGATISVVKGLRKVKRFFQRLFANIGSYEIDEELTRFEEKRSAKILRSSFVLLAGASAAWMLLAVQYPISKIQNLHLSRLEALDIFNSSRKTSHRRPFFKVYYNSYIDTYHQVLRMKRKTRQTWFNMAYKGFARNALTTIPATSIGLLVFEIMRTRLSDRDY